MPLTYLEGSVFSDEEADILCQACNCQHVWGAGIAKEFKKRFPWAFTMEGASSWNPGDFSLYSLMDECNVSILCLYTSEGFGKNRDSTSDILWNTHRALFDFWEYLDWHFQNTTLEDIVIASPRINAGLFGVPWEQTETILQAFVKLTGVNWHVWIPED